MPLMEDEPPSAFPRGQSIRRPSIPGSGVGDVGPVVRGAVLRVGERGRHPDAPLPPRHRPARLDDEDPHVRILGEPPREHASRGAGADEDVVVAGHGGWVQFPNRGQAGRAETSVPEYAADSAAGLIHRGASRHETDVPCGSGARDFRATGAWIVDGRAGPALTPARRTSRPRHAGSSSSTKKAGPNGPAFALMDQGWPFAAAPDRFISRDEPYRVVHRSLQVASALNGHAGTMSTVVFPALGVGRYHHHLRRRQWESADMEPFARIPLVSDDHEDSAQLAAVDEAVGRRRRSTRNANLGTFTGYRIGLDIGNGRTSAGASFSRDGRRLHFLTAEDIAAHNRVLPRSAGGRNFPASRASCRRGSTSSTPGRQISVDRSRIRRSARKPGAGRRMLDARQQRRLHVARALRRPGCCRAKARRWKVISTSRRTCSGPSCSIHRFPPTLTIWAAH